MVSRVGGSSEHRPTPGTKGSGLHSCPVVPASRGVFYYFVGRQRRGVSPCWSLDHRTCPRALVAKRGDVGIREKEGFKCPWFCEHRTTREPKAVVCTLGTLNTDCGEAFSLLRFFVAVGQK